MPLQAKNSKEGSRACLECLDNDVCSNGSGDKGLVCPICWESFNIVENVPNVLWNKRGGKVMMGVAQMAHRKIFPWHKRSVKWQQIPKGHQHLLHSEIKVAEHIYF
ncbi:uncharacterized protein LOC111318293 isoform X1 [Durio zibethinus]|uniref:Uncharacterized protein LOC111318293 isoform X1 n=1 Tax=Durio zibethinus TaxID=66656 RepID=A0A6P6BI68_DURZI|nr:uncharacterized protein LOC111318293 isoform X1 [Durio zibethinus]XP_022776800.1 uncharacterized protein LOC111318293 isoform X1 [Durio zibethinus]